MIPAMSLGIDLSSPSSICNALRLVTSNTLKYYEGSRPGGSIGLFEEPYYWWEAGEAWGGLINVWRYCAPESLDNLIFDSLMAQRGSHMDYVPLNQSFTEGNDDQGFWGFALMEAVETGFKDPPDDQPGWLGLAQRVTASMESRWDEDECGGGLRWQIYTWNKGYTYKNTIANACLFHMAARLAHYTRNETYVAVARRTWTWMMDIGLVQTNGSTYNVLDGTSTKTGCNKVVNHEWSYNYAILLAGHAYLHDFTKDPSWLDHLHKLYAAFESRFYDNGVLFEQRCEEKEKCNDDQKSFKSITSRCLMHTASLIPELAPLIHDRIWASAQAAAQACNDQGECGVRWTLGYYDGNTGLGQQISVSEALIAAISVLQPELAVPLTSISGGTSKGDSNGGYPEDYEWVHLKLVITRKEVAGATLLSILIMGTMIGTGWWLWN